MIAIALVINILLACFNMWIYSRKGGPVNLFLSGVSVGLAIMLAVVLAVD